MTHFAVKFLVIMAIDGELKPSFNSCSCLNLLHLPAMYLQIHFFSVPWKFTAAQSTVWDVQQYEVDNSVI